MCPVNEPFQPCFGQMELRLGHGGFLHILAIIKFQQDITSPHKLTFLDGDFGDAAGQLWAEFDFGRGPLDPSGGEISRGPLSCGGRWEGERD